MKEEKHIVSDIPASSIQAEEKFQIYTENPISLLPAQRLSPAKPHHTGEKQYLTNIIVKKAGPLWRQPLSPDAVRSFLKRILKNPTNIVREDCCRPPATWAKHGINRGTVWSIRRLCSRTFLSHTHPPQYRKQ